MPINTAAIRYQKQPTSTCSCSQTATFEPILRKVGRSYSLASSTLLMIIDFADDHNQLSVRGLFANKCYLCYSEFANCIALSCCLTFEISLTPAPCLPPKLISPPLLHRLLFPPLHPPLLAAMKKIEVGPIDSVGL